MEISDGYNNNTTQSMILYIFISVVLVDSAPVSKTHLGGIISKLDTSTFPIHSDTPQIVNIKKFIEETKTKLQSRVDYLHIQKYI